MGLIEKVQKNKLKSQPYQIMKNEKKIPFPFSHLKSLQANILEISPIAFFRFFFSPYYEDLFVLSSLSLVFGQRATPNEIM